MGLEKSQTKRQLDGDSRLSAGEIKKILEESSFRIVDRNNYQDDATLLNNLIKLYKEAFSSPPWHENLTDGAIEEHLEMLLIKYNGKLLLLTDSQGNLIGFVCAHILSLEETNKIIGETYKVCIERSKEKLTTQQNINSSGDSTIQGGQDANAGQQNPNSYRINIDISEQVPSTNNSIIYVSEIVVSDKYRRGYLVLYPLLRRLVKLIAEDVNNTYDTRVVLWTNKESNVGKMMSTISEIPEGIQISPDDANSVIHIMKWQYWKIGAMHSLFFALLFIHKSMNSEDATKLKSVLKKLLPRLPKWVISSLFQIIKTSPIRSILSDIFES